MVHLEHETEDEQYEVAEEPQDEMVGLCFSLLDEFLVLGLLKLNEEMVGTVRNLQMQTVEVVVAEVAEAVDSWFLLQILRLLL